ncbi:MAG: hypothetical protein QNK23_17535 [Crocinitomicaceae bacterium]|nr:hypothetical protein [Crocinitomicaceae bacterium]
MGTFVKKHVLTFIGIPLGVLGGYLYYHFYGCTNGCAITSSPVNSMLYGALMGGLLFNMFEGRKKKG